MGRIVFENVEMLAAQVGKKVCVSEWLEISQERINLFADATDDHQWIHTEVTRAKRESPHRATIAHGYLTLSLLAYFAQATIEIKGIRQTLNYGLDKVRFPAAVPVNSRLRAHFLVASCEVPISGGLQVTWETSIEREGHDKPVCIAHIIFRYT